MSAQDDAALRARLDADAQDLDADAVAIRRALETPEGERVLVEVAEKLWPFLAPALVGAATGGNPAAGAVTAVALGMVKGALDAKAAQIAREKA